eukprot:snap_masked-scaffold_4-processed-gene-16.32-mRNA-1 protein AED:1.00 eAED:1.00 QI:0/-1/0/0/-1/1/1/0/492
MYSKKRSVKNGCSIKIISINVCLGYGFFLCLYKIFKFETNIFRDDLVADDEHVFAPNRILNSFLNHASPIFLPSDNTIILNILMERNNLMFLKELRDPRCSRLEFCKLQKSGNCFINYDGKRITGQFTFGSAYEVFNLKNQERKMYLEQEAKFLGQEFFPYRKRIRNDNVATLLQCKFTHTLPKRLYDATINIPWPVENKLQMKTYKLHTSNDEFPAPQNNLSCVLCGRALHGKVKAASIIKQVEYYSTYNMTPLVLYDVGLHWIDFPSLINHLLKRNVLIIYDFRRFLLEEYGSLYIYNMLHTDAIAQTWTRRDCFLRAKTVGYNQVAFFDLDEYLYPALPNKGKTDSLEFIFNKLNTMLWVSFGSIKNKKLDDEICAGETKYLLPKLKNRNMEFIFYDWHKIKLRFHRYHRKIERNAPRDYVTYNFTRTGKQNCLKYKLCKGAAGLRKIIVSTRISALHFRTHDVVRSIEYLGEHISTDDAYLRHHRCLN